MRRRGIGVHWPWPQRRRRERHAVRELLEKRPAARTVMHVPGRIMVTDGIHNGTRGEIGVALAPLVRLRGRRLPAVRLTPVLDVGREGPLAHYRPAAAQPWVRRPEGEPGLGYQRCQVAHHAHGRLGQRVLVHLVHVGHWGSRGRRWDVHFVFRAGFVS